MFNLTFRKTFYKRGAIVLLITTLVSVTSFANNSTIQMTGAGFSDACTRADERWISFCNGYIQAVVDGIRDYDKVCLPNGTSRTDLVTIAEREISTSSHLQVMNARDAVILVLQKHYQCR